MVMRYICLIFVLFLMWWTCSVAHTPPLLTEDTHIGIQEDLKRVISDYISENLPNANNLIFEKFWTESLRENQVKAIFSYSFDDASQSSGTTIARVGIEGRAILNRIRQEDSDFDIWSLDELHVDNNKISFKDGLIVNADGKTRDLGQETNNKKLATPASDPIIYDGVNTEDLKPKKIEDSIEH